MATLSVVVITRNEAANIDACLASVDFADEIVVLDSGSTDETVERARARNAKVEVRADWPGYGPQRRRAQALAGGDWILMIDADERVTPELAAAIRAAVQRDDRDRAYALPRLSWCFGRYIRHGGWYPDYVVRLYPRARGRYDDALVHEKVVLDDGISVGRLEGDLLHFTYDSLRHYLEKSAHYAEAWADQRERAGKRASLSQGVVHALGCFVRMYLLRGGFLDGRAGLLLALLSAHSTFNKYADLWLRHQPRRPGA